MSENKIICDLDLERVVLGSIMCNPLAFHEISDILSVDCFVDENHKAVYEAIVVISDAGNDADLTAVATRLKGTVRASVVAEISSCGRYSNLDTYAKVLAELHIRRQLSALGSYLAAKSQSDEADVADTVSYADEVLSNVFNVRAANISTMSDAISGVFRIAERNAKSDTVLTGTPTGLSEFDRKSGGLQKSDLVIVAAETSQGKTSLAISVMKNAAEDGAKIAFYSLEMKKEQIAARMMAIESGIPSNEILFSRMSGSQFKHLDKSVSQMHNLPVYFDDNSTSGIDSIIASIRSMKLKYNIDGVVVDYLQILNVNMKSANKEQQMADVARRLKNTAKDLDIWVIALSQLNRDASNPVPNINRLRDSGQIAEAADVVMFIYRPEVYGRYFPEPFQHVGTGGKALIDVAKGRNIGLLKFITSFDTRTTHFLDLTDMVEVSEKHKEDEPF
jgi:replicative DNA helicase